MTRVLVITIGYPHPERGASSVLFYWYLHALRNTDFYIEHLILVSPENESPEAERQYREAIGQSSRFNVSVEVLNDLGYVRRKGLRLTSCPLTKEVIDRVWSINPQITLSFDILAAEISERIGIGQPIIWLGDLSFQTGLYHAYYDFRGDILKLPQLLRTWFVAFLWKRMYKKILRDKEHVIVSSYSSVKQLSRIGIRSRYFAYPWPAESVRVNLIKKHDKPTFIMFGTLQALGSRSAFDFLLNSVYSKLIKLWGNKGFEVRIAGMRELPDWVNERIASLPEFKFLGFVDDLGSEVSKCHAVLAPISVPVGNRSRIVTAMAMGALVIAHENTTLGNPELISGENCLLAKTASEFARNMQVAYMDPEYSKEIGSAARITYLESFEPQPAAKRLIDLLESIKVQ